MCAFKTLLNFSLLSLSRHAISWPFCAGLFFSVISENIHILRERNVQANMLQFLCLFSLILWFSLKEVVQDFGHRTSFPS